MTDQSVLSALVAALRRASEYDKNDQVAPAVVLWPDKGREWEALIPRLRLHMLVLIYGSYDSEKLAGPAIWLRHALATEVNARADHGDTTPIIYLPGVSRDDLRSMEDLDDALKPLAELQYRGTIWSHPNGRDWSVAGFLSNASRGLALDVKEDATTIDALRRALTRLADEPLSTLSGRQLNADDFNVLLNPDATRSLLLWMNDPEGYSSGCTPDEWGAFRSGCRSEFGIDPKTDGPLTAAERLGARKGPWDKAWLRFAEAPNQYPQIRQLLVAAAPHEMLPAYPECWPQRNADEEDALRQALGGCESQRPEDVRSLLRELEERHGSRRGWLWAKMGEAPLAEALRWLSRLGDLTAEPWNAASVEDLVAYYADDGWSADDAVLRALAAVEKMDDVVAVKTAIEALYRAWLDDGARLLQAAVAKGSFPPGGFDASGCDAGTCVLFTDGLRFDLGHRLANRLEHLGCSVEVEVGHAALPPVTGTAKPALTPVAAGLTAGPGMDVAVHGSTSKVTAEALRRLMQAIGWQTLSGDELGDPSGRAWAEYGDLDQFGHTHGWKLASVVDGEIGYVAQRVAALLGWGWRRVIVVTDHGWLLLPGGLQKYDLREHLTELRKGRCARMKGSASTEFLTLPSHWSASVLVAYAPGAGTFVAGQEYDHGGLSVQELVVPRLSVTSGPSTVVAVMLDSMQWAGLRCKVHTSGAPGGASLDVRVKPADPASSLLASPEPLKDDGTGSGLVSDDTMLGSATIVVVLASDGSVLKQAATIVGGEG